jgi:hypothetical protein
VFGRLGGDLTPMAVAVVNVADVRVRVDETVVPMRMAVGF